MKSACAATECGMDSRHVFTTSGQSTTLLPTYTTLHRDTEAGDAQAMFVVSITTRACFDSGTASIDEEQRSVDASDSNCNA